MARQVMCVYFRANDGKSAADVSRNLHLIDAVTQTGDHALMTDPRDSSVYMLPFPPGTAEETVLQVVRELNNLTVNSYDGDPLLEAWPGEVSCQLIENHGFVPRSRQALS